MKHAQKLSHFRGILAFLYIVINLSFWLIPVILMSLIKLLFPLKRFQDLLSWLMGLVYNIAVWFDDILLFHIIGIRLEIRGVKKLYPEKFYLIIANHQSWNDIFILQHIFNWKAPIPKFLVKRELIYLPVVGLICLAYDFPFLRRGFTEGPKSAQDKIRGDSWTIEKALDKFRRYPASVVNLVEGTRFSDEKAKNQKSPFRYLMKPRAGGITTILKFLGQEIHTILDVTIVYGCLRPNFWNFICGQCPRVIVEVKEYTQEEIPQANNLQAVARWINAIWKKKDSEVALIRQVLNKG